MEDLGDLNQKQIADLRKLAQDYKIAYSHKGRLINKPELIQNIESFLKDGKTPKRGRPKI